MKVGAQKCVIQRVRKSAGSVTSRGFQPLAVKKSRVWSNAIRAMTKPRRRSTLSTRGPAPTIAGLFTAKDLRRAAADESSAPSFGQVSMSLTELAWRTLIYSSWRVGTTRAIRGGAPFRRAFFVLLGPSTPPTRDVEVLGIDRRAGFLPPGLIQPSSIDSIKAKFINEFEDDGLGGRVVARNRASDPPIL